MLIRYIRYLITAQSLHDIHSPFIFDFIKEVLHDKRNFYAFDEIKNLSNKLLSDETFLQIEDFGAGSHLQKTNKRKIKVIAKNAGRNERFGKILFKMVLKYKPQNIVELGTSLGLGTMYLSKPDTKQQIITIEGSKEVAAEATKNFELLQIKNVKIIVGNFDDVLSKVFEEMQKVDLLFVDGNHRKTATLNYFNQVKPYLQNDSIIIFDDIHWSEDMEVAWDLIKNDEMVTCSIDLFFFGIVFFKKEFLDKQHFVLRC